MCAQKEWSQLCGPVQQVWNSNEEGFNLLRTELKKIIFSPQYIICVVVLFVLLMVGTVGFWSQKLGDQTISMIAHFSMPGIHLDMCVLLCRCWQRFRLLFFCMTS